MLVGQQLGPFLIEKELGAGAMGAVYRGKYVKTGQIVAVKIMAPGLGTTSESSTARFEREAAILKQLKHPNIVRLFGVGKYKGTPYYAMEYVKGESLDRVMSRRDRMSWEEVVDLGTQLCAALQHAHEAGIVHRDLKPSNLMILDDGTLKLTDFGIAKDLDVTALTGANCTIGTAAYMSPEQCKGDPHLTLKSDLYSLGVVFYELITGRKPFMAEHAMEMFLQHVNGTFERPSRIVLDLPVWLDNLICQLLEKKPEHRPRDAAMVAEVLSTIQEKVEAQQSAGVDAAKARYMDLPPEKRAASAEDRAAKRTLLGKKGKKGRKLEKKKKRLMLLIQALGLFALLVGVITGIVLLAQPPSADDLYNRADKMMKSEKAERREQARSGPIAEYLRRYGDRTDDKTRQVRLWADDFDAVRYEKLLDRHLRHQKGKSLLAVEAQTPAEEAALKAAVAEVDGDREAANKLWSEALKKDEDTGLSVVARRHMAALAAIDEQDRQFDLLRQKIRNDRTEPDLDDWTQKAFLAFRQERLGDRLGAKRSFTRLQEALGKEEAVNTDPVLRRWQLYAAVKARQMRDSLAEKPQDDAARGKLIQQTVDDLKDRLNQARASLLDVRAKAEDVVALYGKDADFLSPVKEANEVIAAVDMRIPRR